MRTLARSAASAAIGVVLTATFAAPLAPPSGQVGGARPVTTPAPYRGPVDGAVLRLFDPPAQRWSSGHRGVDLAAGVGEAVRSPAAGVVSFSGTVVDRGVVTITHPDGLRSSLEPVVGAPAAGTPVGAGDPVGTVQRSGHCAWEPCVHWGVRRGRTYLDPLELLGVDPVVLLPVP
jgi:murein DD-endopeptidase MepM/ murein hydrolase activator NlpD